MNAVGVFGGLFLVAANALNLADLYFALHVFGEVHDFHMAAGAAVSAMHRICHGACGDFIPMAAKTGGRVDGQPLGSSRGCGECEQ
jgi:hypothetical protein